MLKIVHPICCGIDVHKKFIVCTIGTTSSTGRTSYQTKTFQTHNEDLSSFTYWLKENNCTDICMESTGKYWIPVFNHLESFCSVTLANPKHVKAIKGKKTDKKDSIWITDLFKHGLVPGSYIPPKDIRELRDLCRYYYKFGSYISSEKNRSQNSLTVSNITLDSVVSDMSGKSATRIIDYLLNLSTGTVDREHILSLLHGSMKPKIDDIMKSINGFDISNEQAFKARLSRKNLSELNANKAMLEAKIISLASKYQSTVNILISIPGISSNSAIRIISEIGVDMSVFNSSKHLCSWAGLTPQNHESAGKKKSTKISKAGVYIKPLLVQCALASLKDKSNPYFKNKYESIKKRRGHKKAIIAIARKMLTCIYHMLNTGEVFNPTDITYSDSKYSEEEIALKKIKGAISFLERQGIDVSQLNIN